MSLTVTGLANVTPTPPEASTFQPSSDLRHTLVLVNEDDVDGEFHAKGMNGFAGNNPQPFSLGKALVFQQAVAAGFARVGQRDPVAEQDLF